MKLEKINNSLLSSKTDELWKSPYALLLGIGLIISVISYGLWWLLKWIILSPIRPFTDSIWFCNQGFHKYRFSQEKSRGLITIHCCKVCEKEKDVTIYD